jgi:hypothetical protein
MKKLSILLILITFIFISCSNNEEQISVNESYLELNGIQYELKNGYFVKINTNEFLLQLTDGTINNILALENFSNDTSNGFSTYLFSSELNGIFSLTDISSESLSASADCTKTNTNEFNCNKEFRLNNNSSDTGNITISKNSDIYELNFEFTNGNNDKIKGKFKGKLTELDS